MDKHSKKAQSAILSALSSFTEMDSEDWEQVQRLILNPEFVGTHCDFVQDIVALVISKFGQTLLDVFLTIEYEARRMAFVKCAIRNGYNPCKKMLFGSFVRDSMLVMASRAANMDLVNFICRQASHLITDEAMQKSLEAAAFFSHVEMVLFWMSKGAIVRDTICIDQDGFRESNFGCLMLVMQQTRVDEVLGHTLIRSNGIPLRNSLASLIE